MNTYSVYLPNFTIGGGDVYEKVPEICAAYGKTVVLIGGKTALEKAEPVIRKALENSAISIIGSLWYGGDATEENLNKLVDQELVQEADMVFGFGGGRALDTVKIAGSLLGKPTFTFPTIASNCAPVTKVSVFYDENHCYCGLKYTEAPPKHTFINCEIIAQAPQEYLWAGIGDALSKQYESSFAARGLSLDHCDQLGVDIGANCAMPLIKYGKEAMEAVKEGKVTHALAQVALNIIVTTGLVSVLVNNDLNSAVAHAIYYGSTSLPEGDVPRLHGQVVGFGVLVQLVVDQQMDEFEKVYAFNKSVGLPTCLADIQVDEQLREQLLADSVVQKDLALTPYPITQALLAKAVNVIEAYHKSHEN